MADCKINELCIIGIPSCGYGFESSKSCFIALPADDEYQLEEEIIRNILKERNYETYVALKKNEPGTFAFCTKICSKIITSHFCIVILNPSEHINDPEVKIPNPNVHYEYGLMHGFHKRIIPMQRKAEILPFNINPLDTIKYTKGNFKQKVEDVIDEMIEKFNQNDPSSTPVKPAAKVMDYYNMKGLDYSSVAVDPCKSLYSLAVNFGFNLFNGPNNFTYFGYFHDFEPKVIVLRVKFLIEKLTNAIKELRKGLADPTQNKKSILSYLNLSEKIHIDILIPNDAPKDSMMTRIDGFQKDGLKIDVNLLTSIEIEEFVNKEYDKIDKSLGTKKKAKKKKATPKKKKAKAKSKIKKKA